MPSSSPGSWLRILLAGYYPFLLLLLALLGWLIYLLIRFTMTTPAGWWFSFWPLAWLGVTALQLVRVVPVWFMAPVDPTNLEIQLPPAFLEPIYRLVAEIVRERKLPMPHDIRLTPNPGAWAYENQAGERILVLGGLLISSMTQATLAGIIAHELGHFSAGDTRLSRRAAQRAQTMGCLEALCHGRASMFFNPIIWLIRLYHLGFFLAYLAHSRQQEFAADRHSLCQAGADEAAGTLLLLEALPCLPELRLDNIAKVFVARREPLADIFAEQQRRAVSLDRTDWDDACRKALKKKTTRWDTHPALRDRLKAMGVSPKQAPSLLSSRQAGPPVRDLFPAWDELEKLMSQQWLDAVRIEQAAKQELAQVFLRRPR